MLAFVHGYDAAGGIDLLVLGLLHQFLHHAVHLLVDVFGTHAGHVFVKCEHNLAIHLRDGTGKIFLVYGLLLYQSLPGGLGLLLLLGGIGHFPNVVLGHANHGKASQQCNDQFLSIHSVSYFVAIIHQCFIMSKVTKYLRTMPML